MALQVIFSSGGVYVAVEGVAAYFGAHYAWDLRDQLASYGPVPPCRRQVKAVGARGAAMRANEVPAKDVNSNQRVEVYKCTTRALTRVTVSLVASK